MKTFLHLSTFLDFLFGVYKESLPESYVRRTSRAELTEHFAQVRELLRRNWVLSFHDFRRHQASAHPFTARTRPARAREVSRQERNQPPEQREILSEVSALNTAHNIFRWDGRAFRVDFGWRHETSSAAIPEILRWGAVLSGHERLRRGVRSQFGETQVVFSERPVFDEVWVSSLPPDSVAEFAWVIWFDQFPVTFGISRALAARPSGLRLSRTIEMYRVREALDQTDQWVLLQPHVPLEDIGFVFADHSALQTPPINSLPKHIERVSYQAVRFLKDQQSTVNRRTREFQISPREALRQIMIEYQREGFEN